MYSLNSNLSLIISSQKQVCFPNCKMIYFADAKPISLPHSLCLEEGVFLTIEINKYDEFNEILTVKRYFRRNLHSSEF